MYDDTVECRLFPALLFHYSKTAVVRNKPETRFGIVRQLKMSHWTAALGTGACFTLVGVCVIHHL